MLTVVLIVIAGFLHGTRAEAEVVFERMEVSIDRPVDAWIDADVDGDGDADLILFDDPPAAHGRVHRATLIRQQPTGRYASAQRQDLPLADSGGVYELADVAGDATMELVQMSRNGVRYFTFSGDHYLPDSQVLIGNAQPPQLPAVSRPKTWDFGWPVIPNHKECILLPYTDRLEMWSANSKGTYAMSKRLPCGTVCDLSEAGDATFSLTLPELRAASTPTLMELFVQSGRRWHGLRRSAPDQTDFSVSLSFDAAPTETDQLLGISPDFRAGALLDDLNGDGAPDVVRWNNRGGLNQASCQVDVYFGPFNARLPDKPHAQVTVEGVLGFPVFGDLNGDGRKDMVVCAMETGTVAAAKVFVMKRLGLHLVAYRQRTDNSFSVVADARESFDYKLDLDMPRPVVGPIALFGGDLDGDGLEDLVVQTGEDHLEIFLGDAKNMFNSDSPERLTCARAVAIESKDIDGDGRKDLFLYHGNDGTTSRFTALLTR